MNIHFLPVSYRSTGVSTERSSQGCTFKHGSGGSGSMPRPRLLRLTSCIPCLPPTTVGTFLSFCFSTLFPIFIPRGKSAPDVQIYIYIYILDTIKTKQYINFFMDNIISTVRKIHNILAAVLD